MVCALSLVALLSSASAWGADRLALIAKPTYRAGTEVLTRSSRNRPDLLPQYLVCMTMLQRERFADAQRTCRPLTLLDPDNPAGYRMLGAAELGLKEYSAAHSDLLHAIALDTGDADGYALLASLYREERQYTLAIRYFTVAIRKRPYDGRMWNGRCWVRAISGMQLARAKADCARAFALYPDSTVLDSMGFVALRLADYRDAYRYYDAALIVDPALATSLFGRGVAKLHLFGAAKAREDIRAAVEKDASAGTFFFEAHLLSRNSPLLQCEGDGCRSPVHKALPVTPKPRKHRSGPVEVTKL
jgi:tetratricopeptide (TPR) repeat protein